MTPENNYEAESNRILDEYSATHGLGKDIGKSEHKSPSKLARKAGALFASLIIAGSVGANAETTDGTPAPGPVPAVEATPSAPEDEFYLTEAYTEKQKRIAEYKELLIVNECQEINLEACAYWLDSMNDKMGFSDRTFVNQEKTIVGNYVFAEQIMEFGRTGKVKEDWNWDVIYHKDKNGKKTKEPGFMYAANPENKVFEISKVQEVIDWWEAEVPGFLRVLNANNVWGIFQSDACDESNKIQVFKYGNNFIYFNYSSNELTPFQAGLYNMALGKEQFGVMGDAVGFGQTETALIKARLAVDCCKYIYKKTGSKFIAGRIKSFQQEIDDYTKKYGNGISAKEIEELVKKAKSLMTPYGANTWEEIDSINVTSNNK